MTDSATRASATRLWRGRHATAISLALMLAGPAHSGVARAEPLAKETCDTLTTEHAGLVAAGLAETVKKGPAWGRANLTSAQLAALRRYIELEEQLLFRCGLAAVRGQPGAEGEEGEDSASADTSKPDAPPPLPTRRPERVAKPAASPAAPTPASVASGGQLPLPRPKPPVPAAKPKPRPKADDAYRPPRAAQPPVAPPVARGVPASGG